MPAFDGQCDKQAACARGVFKNLGALLFGSRYVRVHAAVDIPLVDFEQVVLLCPAPVPRIVNHLACLGRQASAVWGACL